MAIFLRGNVWWMEYRTRKVRKVLSTGFRKEDRAKAQAAFDALRLGFGARPRRSAMENVLEAIYGVDRAQDDVLALSSLWDVYEDWMAGKGKVVSRKEFVERRGMVSRFVAWSGGRSIERLEHVDVAVSRAFVRGLRDAGLSNKTQRRIVSVLSSVWEAVGQLRAGVHNPWKAAMPDIDGTAEVRLAFSRDQEARVLQEAERIGHGWWLASMIARWTGLRYGDVARLDWGDVDLDKRVIELRPSKTRRHGVVVMVPISDALLDALARIPHDKRTGWVLPEHALAYPRGFKGDAAFAVVLASAGVDTERYTFHSWRHTFRTRLADAGVPDDVARRLGGWTNLAMAAHYDHASHIQELREAVAAMEAR